LIGVDVAGEQVGASRFADVVDPDVDLSVLLDDRCHSSGYLFGLQNVGHDRVEVWAVLADGGQALLVSRNDDHLGASSREVRSHLQAKAV